MQNFFLLKRQTDRFTDRQTQKQTRRQTKRDFQTVRQTRNKSRQTDKQTDEITIITIICKNLKKLTPKTKYSFLSRFHNTQFTHIKGYFGISKYKNQLVIR